MKHRIIPSLHSLVIITLCLSIAGAFIYLSTRELNKDVELANQTIDIENMYGNWNKPKYQTKQIDVSFKYDTRQVDDVHIVNYDLTNKVGEDMITQKEIEILLNCYKNEICEDIDISARTEYLINNYKNFLIKDDFVIVYGLYPDMREESFGEIENNIFIINEQMFANIVNSIYSKTNKKYDGVRRDFLINNVDIEYSDYTNQHRIEKKDDMIQLAVEEILEEETSYVREDIDLLKIIAESVSFLDKENN
ncbi:MAG: hypothetical protein ACKUBY_02945 [Candidatus Moraniibacteriota bacterium]|jgi:hypothetical protein